MPNENFIIENEMSEPKGSLGVFELPCGLLTPDGELFTEVRVREITGVEEDMLASKKVPATKKMGQLLVGCTQGIGPFSDPTQVAALVPKLLVGDRVFLLLAIRRVSLGDEYPFRSECPECEVQSLFNIDLSGLEVKPMPEPRKRSYEVVTPKGRKVQWHPMDGAGEQKLANLGGEADKVTMALLVRLDAVDDSPPTLSGLKALGMSERNFLRDCFQEAEGGVDTGMEMECPKCSHEYKIELDIGQQGFFFPSVMRRASKSKSGS